MKKTRRIEITRYRRTVIQGDGGPADRPLELSAIPFGAEQWDMLPNETQAPMKVISPVEVPARPRRSLFGLRKWLKQNG